MSDFYRTGGGSKLKVYDACSKPFRARSQTELDQIAKYMVRNFDLFQQIQHKVHFNEFLSKLEPKIYYDGDLIMRRGDPGDWLCILVEG